MVMNDPIPGNGCASWKVFASLPPVKRAARSAAELAELREWLAEVGVRKGDFVSLTALPDPIASWKQSRQQTPARKKPAAARKRRRMPLWNGANELSGGRYAGGVVPRNDW
jgi:hypothetical protein